MVTPPFGVSSLGVALGERRSVADTVADYVDDPARVLRWGYRNYHRATDVTGDELAARAARAALEDAGAAPSDLDLLVLANSDVPEYYQWDPSAALARRLGTDAVPCVLCTQGCAGGATALQHVAGVYATQPEVETVLLVAANLVSEAHTNRMQFNTCLTSDGAAAVVFQRGHPRLQWRATRHVTDASCVDFFRLEYGGRAVPEPPPGRTNRDVDPLGLVYDHFREDPQHLRSFTWALQDRLVSVIHQTCASAGTTVGDLAKLVYIHDNQRSIENIARALSLPVERTNADVAAETGHCGAADHFISLRSHLDRDELRRGDLVALAGTSAGMHWYCSVFAV